MVTDLPPRRLPRRDKTSQSSAHASMPLPGKPRGDTCNQHQSTVNVTSQVADKQNTPGRSDQRCLSAAYVLHV